MIQRVQSIYLFLVAILMLTTLFFPIMEVVRAEETSSRMLSLLSLGTYSFLPNIALPALSLIVGIMALITIFLYRKRHLQIKFCGWILALILLLYASIFYSYITLVSKMDENTTFFPGITIAFPLIALILDCMAIAGIRKDQRIVSSLDRLR